MAIVEVARGSEADSRGFRPGDVIREVNGEAIASAEAMAEAASAQTRWWRFTLQRGNQVINQTLRF